MPLINYSLYTTDGPRKDHSSRQLLASGPILFPEQLRRAESLKFGTRPSLGLQVAARR
jgi:hypothetical protein